VGKSLDRFSSIAQAALTGWQKSVISARIGVGILVARSLSSRLQAGNRSMDVDGEIEAVYLIAGGELQWRVNAALFSCSRAHVR